MTKTIQYCKVISLQLNKLKKIKTEKKKIICFLSSLQSSKNLTNFSKWLNHIAFSAAKSESSCCPTPGCLEWDGCGGCLGLRLGMQEGLRGMDRRWEQTAPPLGSTKPWSVWSSKSLHTLSPSPSPGRYRPTKGRVL